MRAKARALGETWLGVAVLDGADVDVDAGDVVVEVVWVGVVVVGSVVVGFVAVSVGRVSVVDDDVVGVGVGVGVAVSRSEHGASVGADVVVTPVSMGFVSDGEELSYIIP